MKPGGKRLFAISIIFIALFTTMFVRLGQLTVSENEYYSAQAESKKTKTMTLTGMRGKILDVNMTPLAYNRQSYNVEFYRDPSRSSSSDRREYTEAIIEAIRIIESNGKSTISGFWLERDENGEWRFNTGATNDAQNARWISQWRSNFSLSSESKYPLDTLFDTLCKNYSIPADMSEEEKIKVLAIWQEQRMNNYLSRPVTIAYDVGFKTVAEIEARSDELLGVSVAESSTRVYPKKDLAAHTVGYIGKIISEESMEDYLARGYSRDAMVGLAGIEASMEDQLTANIEYRQGKRVVEVNNTGKIIREIQYDPPVDGNTVVLTIDSQLQAVSQEALIKIIGKINNEQQKMMNSEDWRKRNSEVLRDYMANNRDIQTAQTGALIAMDPNTGRILALASHPTYDLSILTDNDTEAWNAVVNDPRNPLLNRTIGTRDTPGSIFKMVTALGGLMEGVITLDTTYTDLGPYEGTDLSYSPSCWISKGNRYKHADLNVERAIAFSCNYFFYTVGEDLTSLNITKWAAQLGLTSRTGIELNGEATSFVGNQDKLYDASRAIDDQYTEKPRIAANAIKAMLYRIGEDRNIKYDENRINRVTKSLLDIAASDGLKDTWVPQIHEILMTDMNLPREYIQNKLLGNEVYYYLNDLRWTSNETIMAAIGQSITQVTPIAVARYVAAIANGGTVYNAQLIDRIITADGQVTVKQPTVSNVITGADEYLATIRLGMEDVTSVENDGTAANVFRNTKYKIAAKTGTAQRTTLDIENNAWLVAYAPADNPQIVVVVYIQNGYAGAQAGQAAIEVIEYYLDNVGNSESTAVTPANSLAD